MRKFILKVLLFFITFFVVDKAFYVFLLISPKLEKDKRLESVITGNLNKDLIVLGSSRGARNIIAGQLEDSLNILAYNLSYPGSDIEFHDFLLSSVIKFNKKPKIILLVVDDPYELSFSGSIKFRFDRLYPLAKYDYINNEMIKRGEKNNLSRTLILSRINRANFDLRTKRSSIFDSLRICGSMTIPFEGNSRKLVFNSSKASYTICNELPNKIKAFNNIQNICFTNNIKLIIVYPPNFKTLNTSFKKRIEELSHSSVSFLTYDTTKEIYRNKDLFYDENHLNENGAIIFTNEVINQLKEKGKIYNVISNE